MSNEEDNVYNKLYESGISIGENTDDLENPYYPLSSKIILESEFNLEDLNLRLANCIDKTTPIGLIPKVEHLASIQDLGYKVDQLRDIYDKDVARIVKKCHEMHNKVLSQQQANKKLSNEYTQLKKRWIKNEKKLKKLKNEFIVKQNEFLRVSLQVTSLEETLEATTKKYNYEKKECVNLKEQIEIAELENIEKDTEIDLLRSEISNETSGRQLDRDVYLKCEKEYLDQIRQLEQALHDRDTLLKESDNFTVEKLSELREEFENEFLQHYSEIQCFYEDKCATLDASLSYKTNELDQLHILLDDIQPKYNEAKLQLNSLQHQVASLEYKLEETAQSKREKETFYQNKIKQLERILNNFTIGYQHLSNDLNVSLENQLCQKTQLQTLSKLIETGEHRLSILPTDKPLKRKSSISVNQEQSTLDIEVANSNEIVVISDWSYRYEYVTIKNISQTKINLNGYYIENFCEHENVQVFYLEPNIEMDSEQSIKIFSQHANPNYVTSKDIVADTIDIWFHYKTIHNETPWKISLKNDQTDELSCLNVNIDRNKFASKKFLTHEGPINSKRSSCTIL